jgi:uncharacterized membrane protein YqjE
METSSPAEGASPLTAASGRLAQRLFVTCENRLQLLLVELQEERERFLRTICLALVTLVFGLLTGIVITLIIIKLFWEHSPLTAMIVLAAVYALSGLICSLKLRQLQKDWQTLPATIEQLKKDRECLEKHLG